MTPTEVLAGGTTQLSVTVSNFELVAVGGDHDASPAHEHDDDDHDALPQGHYHVYVDSTEGTEPILMGGTAEAELTIEATPGEHTLIVRLQDLTHRTIDPEVTDEAAITVMAPMGAGGGGTGGNSATGGSSATGGAGGS